MELTKQEIQSDIENYQRRIEKARQSMLTLPIGETWQQRKQAEASKRALSNEIKTVRLMLGYAADALRELDSLRDRLTE